MQTRPAGCATEASRPNVGLNCFEVQCNGGIVSGVPRGQGPSCQPKDGEVKHTQQCDLSGYIDEIKEKSQKNQHAMSTIRVCLSRRLRPLWVDTSLLGSRSICSKTVLNAWCVLAHNKRV